MRKKITMETESLSAFGVRIIKRNYVFFFLIFFGRDYAGGLKIKSQTHWVMNCPWSVSQFQQRMETKALISNARQD